MGDRLKEDFRFYIVESSRIIQNFQHLFPYFYCIPKKTSIFVIRFQSISVMKQAESGFYFVME